jgi:hypothetical protein
MLTSEEGEKGRKGEKIFNSSLIPHPSALKFGGDSIDSFFFDLRDWTPISQ